MLETIKTPSVCFSEIGRLSIATAEDSLSFDVATFFSQEDRTIIVANIINKTTGFFISITPQTI